MQWTDNSRIKRLTKIMKERDRLSSWHRWFAWYPVSIGRDPVTGSPIKAWFSMVLRCYTFHEARMAGSGENLRYVEASERVSYKPVKTEPILTGIEGRYGN